MNISPAMISLMQSQVLGSLMGSSSGARRDESWDDIFSLLVSNGAQFEQQLSSQLLSDPLSLLPASSAINQAGSIKGLFAAGRNMALADPESAYKMMSVINERDVIFKAQFSELNEMKSYVSRMQEAGQSLGSITTDTGNDSIKSRLQGFVEQYNNWIQRFNADLQKGGLLAGTQAAQVSQFELEQNINNRFFGVNDGVHGLGELGFSIDPNTRLASLDTVQLDLLLASNKQGAVDAVQEFSVNFAKSASLLNSDGNFIPNQLDNLDRAIHFIADNKVSLQAEFGTGNAAKPAGQVARALAAYNQAYGV